MELSTDEVDKTKQAGSVSAKCSYPLCPIYCYGHCDNCGHAYCLDHGSRGGDVRVQEVGAVAIPGLCWKCGGFNAYE